MIGLDTNILVRACLEDDKTQAEIAKKLIAHLADQCTLFVSSYALLELVWVLKVKGISRQKISTALLTLIDSPGVEVAERETVLKAIEYYEAGKADFGDYLIMTEGERYRCKRLATFDQVLLKEQKHCYSPEQLIC